MLKTIGTRPAPRSAQTLRGMLQACHERIRHFLQVALNAAEHPTAGDSERRQACAAVRRYFVDALPLHSRDEEESLAPRLRGKSGELDHLLLRMQEEHRESEALVLELVRACERLGKDPRSVEVRHQLGGATARAQAFFELHLGQEEQQIFARIDELLSGQEQLEICDEMRARRPADSFF